MKKIFLISLIFSVFFALASCKAENAETVTVFQDGKTDYSIVLASGASDDEKSLANGLLALSGAQPALLTDESAETDFEILIGETNRSESSKCSLQFADVASVNFFHYIIAEDNGKIVIISDAEIGYIYALEYLKENYISNGKFLIPKGICELKEVLWDAYYSSDLYLDRLLADAEENRFQSDKDYIGNEIGKYDDTSNPVMSYEQMEQMYRDKIASFDTTAFGGYSSYTFIGANTYAEPDVTPEVGAHPRVLFTENTIDDVRANITSKESKNAYDRYIALSDASCDGFFKTLTGNQAGNYDSSITARIEARAFRYAMTGEKIYGYEAIYAVKNAILTIELKSNVGDRGRAYGHLMYVAACVYDWCYDLMTEEDKEQLIAGGVNILGKNQEAVAYVGSTNLVPSGQGTVFGHGCEDEILVDYFSFAIACYDEAPEIYDFVAGRIFEEHVPGHNFMAAQSGMHYEGSMYGSVRSVSTVVCNILINRMTDGEVTPFENLEAVITGSYYWIRPDGQVYRIGDINQNSDTYQFMWFANNCFYVGNMYGNEWLKSVAYKYLNGFKSFSDSVAGLSAVQFLAVNDPDVEHTYNDEISLTYTAKYPNSSLFAKSDNTSNAFGVYMTMPEFGMVSHSHMDCGSFQIYYKGALAIDSGSYDTWGSVHHMGYCLQTVSSNSLLIYNPKLKDYINSLRPNMVYSGGQSIEKGIGNGTLTETTLDQLINEHPGFNSCTSLGIANVEKDGKYLYSYMGGDMTKAYDDETVDEVCRYMISIPTGNSLCPYAVLTFDRITSDDSSFHKSALIHVMNEPTITSNGFAIITNGDGKLVVQTVGDATEYAVVGGEGKEFWIAGVDENGNYSLEDGRNIPTNLVPVENSINEYGWGRIEISPAEADYTNYMLTVMYVTDATNNATPTKAQDISSDNLAGAMIFGKAVLFSKNEKLLTEQSSFTLTQAGECYVAGVSAGKWTVTCGGSIVDTIDVKEGTNMFTFNANSAGTYTLTPAN